MQTRAGSNWDAWYGTHSKTNTYMFIHSVCYLLCVYLSANKQPQHISISSRSKKVFSLSHSETTMLESQTTAKVHSLQTKERVQLMRSPLSLSLSVHPQQLHAWRPKTGCRIANICIYLLTEMRAKAPSRSITPFRICTLYFILMWSNPKNIKMKLNLQHFFGNMPDYVNILQ